MRMYHVIYRETKGLTIPHIFDGIVPAAMYISNMHRRAYESGLILGKDYQIELIDEITFEEVK